MFKESLSFLPLAAAVERARADDGEYFTSAVSSMERARADEGESLALTTQITTTEERTESIVEERRVRQEDSRYVRDVPSPQTSTERDDDWFILLDVATRLAPYVPPGTANSCIILCLFCL